MEADVSPLFPKIDSRPADPARPRGRVDTRPRPRNHESEVRVVFTASHRKILVLAANAPL